MLPAPAEASWQEFRAAAQAAGLNVLRVLPRERIDPHFPADAAGAPARLHPGYRAAVLVGSGGRSFWQQFRAAGPSSAAHPLDSFTAGLVERLAAGLRAADPTLVTVYPFTHARQILPFRALTRGLADQQTLPFGVALDRRFGPWFAWRAVLLTALTLDTESPQRTAVCAGCPAPCVAACPPGAARKEGFDLDRCTSFRATKATCRETCLARVACPVAADQRYGPEQMAFHYRASLASILAYRGGGS